VPPKLPPYVVLEGVNVRVGLGFESPRELCDVTLPTPSATKNLRRSSRIAQASVTSWSKEMASTILLVEALEVVVRFVGNPEDRGELADEKAPKQHRAF
jgi:hypothetical protein